MGSSEISIGLIGPVSPWGVGGGGWGGVSHIKRTGTRVKSGFSTSYNMFSLKRSTVEAFAVLFGVLSRKNYDNVLF